MCCVRVNESQTFVRDNIFIINENIFKKCNNLTHSFILKGTNICGAVI